MWKYILLLQICLSGYCYAGPLGGLKKNIPIIQREDELIGREPILSETDDEISNHPLTKPASPADLSLISTLTLPSNATSIRADITDRFSCEDRAYGYYADVDNDCQIFHVCLPVTYADGKENTFRWSFICPEETVFSQDSFTCMRPADMTIGCDESAKYYELNRNFGVIDDEANKESTKNKYNNHKLRPAVLNEDKVPEAIVYPEQQQQQLQPQYAEDEKLVDALPAASAPVPVEIKPLKEIVQKPVKVAKPNRKKPSSPFGAQKKPSSTYPLRKMPQLATAAPAVEVAETQSTDTSTNTIVVQQEEEVRKPLPQRFTKRPLTASIPESHSTTETIATAAVEEEVKRPVLQRFTKRPATSPTVSNKEKPEPEPIKVETNPSRTDLYNQLKRKRPSIFDKKPTKEPLESDTKLPESQNILETKQTLKTTPTETVAQASEQTQVILKPEPIVQITSVLQPVPEKAVNENDKSNSLKGVALEQLNIGDKVELPIKPIEAIEEIPAIVAEIEEHKQPTIATDENTEIAAALSPPSAQSVKPEEEEEADKIKEENIKLEQSVKLPLAAPAIFEENSEEGAAPILASSAPALVSAAPTLEELEDAKPANAIEVVSATPEMEHPDPVVQELLDQSNDNKESMGGFKPVDPEMAAEAESLIAEFINQLKKADQLDMKPIVPTDLVEEAQTPTVNNEVLEKVEDSHDTVKLESEDALKSQELIASETEQRPIQLAQTDSANEESQLLTNTVPLPQLLVNHYPSDVYQIPVQVIQTPVEESANPVDATEQQQQSEQLDGQQSTANYVPVSIDDIVEMVKERLDQMPESEKNTPIELVMEPVSGENPTEDKLVNAISMKKAEEQQNSIDGKTPEAADDKTKEESSETGPQEDKLVKKVIEAAVETQKLSDSKVEPIETNEAIKEVVAEKPAEEEKLEETHKDETVAAESTPASLEEPAILPIYHRLTDAESNAPHALLPAAIVSEETSSSTANVANANSEKAEETEQATIVAADSNSKTGRTYRPRKTNSARMNPRKRSFLFRSDAS